MRDIKDRYTYINGSTSAGLVVYDDKYAYSNHSTDPAGEQLCNAFDLVRIHRYADLDENVREGTPTSKLPSYKEALKFIEEDTETKKTIVKEGIKTSKDDFKDVDISEYDDSWLESLAVEKGQVVSSIDNIVTIL